MSDTTKRRCASSRRTRTSYDSNPNCFNGAARRADVADVPTRRPGLSRLSETGSCEPLTPDPCSILTNSPPTAPRALRKLARKSSAYKGIDTSAMAFARTVHLVSTILNASLSPRSLRAVHPRSQCEDQPSRPRRFRFPYSHGRRGACDAAQLLHTPGSAGRPLELHQDRQRDRRRDTPGPTTRLGV